MPLAHRIQERNRHLADACKAFFKDRDLKRLARRCETKTAVDKIMVIGYLLAADMIGPAGDLADLWHLNRWTLLALLDTENGRELAAAMGWLGEQEAGRAG